MPETYGLPEPEPTRSEQAETILVNAIAGQGIVRRVVLYAVLGASLVLGIYVPPVLVFGMLATILLVATDTNLS